MPYSVISLYSFEEMNCIMKHKIHINAHVEMPLQSRSHSIPPGEQYQIIIFLPLALVGGGRRKGRNDQVRSAPSLVVD